MSDIVDQETSGWLQEPDLFEQIMNHAKEGIPDLTELDGLAMRIGMESTFIILRDRLLLNEEGLKQVNRSESKRVLDY